VPATEASVPFVSRFASFAAAALLALGGSAQDLSLSLPVRAEDVLNGEEQLTVNLFERNNPGVVFITNEAFQIEAARDNAMRMELVPTGSGSGWVYDDDGHIVTNYHVIKDANVVTVRFIDGAEVKATVVGADPGSDVAVLKVELPKARRNLLTKLDRGESASLRVGQEVFAIGNPFGLDHTLTKGIVSGVGRTIMSIGGRPIQGAIQTDASINPGNSGGPLLNSAGKVVGMNTLIFSPSGASAGVGFAIPGDTVGARVASILKYGYVKRPSLGLYLGQDGITKRMANRDGALVAGVSRGSCSGAAGVRPGDILVSIDGAKIKRVNDVYKELDEREPGDTIKVRLLRPEISSDGQSLELDGQRNARYTELDTTVRLDEAPTQA